MLAHRLGEYARRRDVLVLALPSGGVPIAEAVGRTLQLPFDVFLVRQLGVPGQEELAFGAIASGGVQMLNSGIVEAHGLTGPAIAEVAQREKRELARCERVYRGSRPLPALRGRTVILVDDGIAKAAGVCAALIALRHLGVATLVVAAPVIDPETHAALQGAVDRIFAVLIPGDFSRVDDWYEDFTPTTDEAAGVLLGGSPVFS